MILLAVIFNPLISFFFPFQQINSCTVSQCICELAWKHLTYVLDQSAHALELSTPTSELEKKYSPYNHEFSHINTIITWMNDMEDKKQSWNETIKIKWSLQPF